MDNLVQIICGAGGAETIEECARVTERLGGTIIVVYALWPQYEYPNGDPNFARTADLVAPDHRLDDVESIARAKGWHFLPMNKFAFNGEQYNFALDYIEGNGIPCDHLWFVDSDECIDIGNAKLMVDTVARARAAGVEQLRFSRKIEILPGWKQCELDNVIGGNYGVVWGEAVKVRRETFFDGNFYFKSPVSCLATTIPLLHLHAFRRNASVRIDDGKWRGGGLEIDISQAPDLYDSEYTRFLKTRFTQFHTERGHIDSYLGMSIFDGRS